MKDGGPAFGGYARRVNTVGGQEWFDDTPVMGMSMRDYFAAAALQSILRHTDNRFLPEDDAEWCYSIADALLAEREKSNGP